MAGRNLTPSDVVAAIREQNLQMAAGTLGQQPAPEAAFEVSLASQTRLTAPEQFRRIIVKRGDGGQLVRLGEVARVELGANTSSLRSLLALRNADGTPGEVLPAAAMPINGRLERSRSPPQPNRVMTRPGFACCEVSSRATWITFRSASSVWA